MTVGMLAAEIDALRELLREVVMDYGALCTTPGCSCSMGRAKRVVDGERDNDNDAGRG